VTLPQFIGIGALKAGTSYLDAMLRTHPELCLPPTTKEVDFFSHHYERGVDWYEGHFAQCEGRVPGEVSPRYLFDGRCPGRIASVIPRALLVASVRDPVQRLHSQYKHWVQETRYPGSFDDFLQDHPDSVGRGMYFQLLSPYLEVFPADQLHVVVFEDMLADPVAALQGIFGFLGVDPNHVPSNMDQAVNASGRPRFHAAYGQAKRLSRWLHDHAGSGVVAAVKRLPLERLFRNPEKGVAFDSMSADTTRRLADTYGKDVEALSRLLDRELHSIWLQPAVVRPEH